MKTKLLALKNELKFQASEIRRLKSTRSYVNSGYVHGLFSEQHSYRIKHIAYCLARGTEMEKIESKNHPGKELTKYDQQKIESIIADLSKEEAA